MACLRHPVRLEQRHAVHVLEALHQRRGHRRAARTCEAECRRRDLRGLLVEDHLVQSRAGGEPRHPVSARLPPEALRTEPSGHNRRPARRERAEHRGDEPVHVEERHRHIGHVARSERVMGGDRSRRGDQVPLQQRHLLGPARRAARVQEQRGVVGDARLERLLALDRASVDCEPGRLLLGDDDVHDRDLVSGRLPGRLHVTGRDEQEARLEIAEIEGVLVGRVGRVERCRGGSERRDREQDLDELGPVSEARARPDRRARPRPCGAAPRAEARPAPAQRR